MLTSPYTQACPSSSLSSRASDICGTGPSGCRWLVEGVEQVTQALRVLIPVALLLFLNLHIWPHGELTEEEETQDRFAKLFLICWYPPKVNDFSIIAPFRSAQKSRQWEEDLQQDS